MILEVNHRTHYAYTEAIFPEPSHLYLHPAVRPHFHVRDHQIQVYPKPSGLSPRMDVENNTFYQMWFNGTLTSLTIDTSLRVDIVPYNPFDFLLETEPRTPHQEAVVPYLQVTEKLTSAMLAWSMSILEVTSDNLIFVTMMAREIGEHWEHVLRYEADLLPIDLCFTSKKGSCRDLSWMMIQVLRHHQIPARFVSGYAFNPELEGHELHGWVEVWLKGAGWVAVDPSAGLLATEYYIPLAASYHPANTLPVQGAFRGQASAKLTTSVDIGLVAGNSPD
ncbi:MAG: transglutaminase family protein [Bacteroidota bacterium]